MIHSALSETTELRTDEQTTFYTDVLSHLTSTTGIHQMRLINRPSLYWVSQKKLLHKSDGKSVPNKEADLAES